MAGEGAERGDLVRFNPCNAKKGVNCPRVWVRRVGIKPR